MKTLQSWRNVITPRAEVMQGRFDNLAADLIQATQGQGGEEYSNPVEFFSRTYVTDGIRGLMMEALKRVTGQHGAHVIQVKTAFGGGKTHSMLALYHLMHGGFNARSVPVVREMMDELGLSALPRVNVAVISGTFEGVSEPREVANIPVNTLWGNIAAQLGGYEYVSAADRDKKAPGAFALLKMFEACGPCLVLIDELTAYGRKLYGAERSSAGTFGNFQTFVQELTEAAKYSKNSLVVAAMPESKTENGDDDGVRVFDILDNIFRRVESVWKPVEPREGFEVVKLRLFQDCVDDSAREETAEAFYEMYNRYSDDFPAEAHTAEYKERLISCYPIHPEIFDRLYGEWSVLQKFQRTRGVLGFLAEVVHDLWESGDASPLIMPGSINVADKDIHSAITGALESSAWNAILDNEIDGADSVPCLLDKRDRFREYSAARRVARTVLLGSAPSARGQAVRGVEKSRILLGTVRPEENISVYTEALGELRGSLSYLYANDAANRFWYDTIPTLRKKAAELKEQQRDSDVEAEIRKRLVSLKGSAMVSHLWPKSEGDDVPDSQSVRLVILSPTDGEAEALKILLSRKFRNMLLFVKADPMKLDDLREAVRVYLAWKYIARESRTLNLTEQQLDEARKTIDKTSTEIERLTCDAWSVVLVPECLDGRNVDSITWRTEKAKNAGTITAGVLSALNGDELSRNTSPDALKEDVARYIWKDSDDIEVKRLWELLCTYCYLPRIVSFGVLEAAIRGGIERKYFALAHGKNGREYAGLTMNAPSSVEMTDYLVRREVAEPLITPPEPPKIPTVPTTTTQIHDILPIDDTPKPKAIHNFSMSAELLEDPTPAKYFMKLYNDIIAVLQQDVSGAVFDLTLEVNMHAADPIPNDTRKIVEDNCKAHKVNDYSFD